MFVSAIPSIQTTWQTSPPIISPLLINLCHPPLWEASSCHQDVSSWWTNALPWWIALEVSEHPPSCLATMLLLSHSILYSLTAIIGPLYSWFLLSSPGPHYHFLLPHLLVLCCYGRSFSHSWVNHMIFSFSTIIVHLCLLPFFVGCIIHPSFLLKIVLLFLHLSLWTWVYSCSISYPQ